MKRKDRNFLMEAVFTVLLYIGVIILIIGLLFTFLDVMQFTMVKNFIYNEFWHAMAFIAVSIFYIHRITFYLCRQVRSLLRDFAGFKSYEERLEDENLELKDALLAFRKMRDDELREELERLKETDH